jgi:hypothetical protein
VSFPEIMKETAILAVHVPAQCGDVRFFN